MRQIHSHAARVAGVGLCGWAGGSVSGVKCLGPHCRRERVRDLGPTESLRGF